MRRAVSQKTRIKKYEEAIRIVGQECVKLDLNNDSTFNFLKI
jgi:hypothetical protein